MLGFGLSGSLVAQKAQRIVPLKAQGEIPLDFRLTFQEKYLRALEEASPSTDSLKEELKLFWEQTHFYLHELLLSGKVLFNDPVSAYVNQVLDTLLAQAPQIRSQLRVYAVKSPAFNAFSTSDGVILINVGLIARLENEAQLAFILAHEVSHFLEKHSLNIYLTTRSLEERLKNHRMGNNYERIWLENTLYSDLLEIEADRLGLGLLAQSPYSTAESLRALELLSVENISMGDQPFDPLSLGQPYTLPHPSGREGWPLAPPEPPEPDTLVAERMKALSQVLDTMDTHGGVLWRAGETQFYDVRTLCLWECCHLLIAQAAYEKAFHLAYSLLTRFPDNRYLKGIVGHSLYALAVFRRKGKFWEVHLSPEWVSGPVREVAVFFESLGDKALLELALDYNSCLWVEDPGSERKEQVVRHLYSLWEQLTRNESQQEVERGPAYGCWAALVQDSLWVSDTLENFPREADKYNMTVASRKKWEKRQIEKGLDLGLERVVFVNPEFFQIDDRALQPVKFRESLQGEEDISTLLHKHAQTLGLGHQILRPQPLSVGDESRFNDQALLSAWFEERVSHHTVPLVSIYHDQIQSVQQKLGTPYFVWVASGSLARKRDNRGLVLAAGILLPVMLPYSVYYNMTPLKVTYLYAVIYDIRDGNELARYPMMVRMKDHWDVINALVYDFVFQLRQEKKIPETSHP